jgi:surfeit locus 1 family protein
MKGGFGRPSSFMHGSSSLALSAGTRPWRIIRPFPACAKFSGSDNPSDLLALYGIEGRPRRKSASLGRGTSRMKRAPENRFATLLWPFVAFLVALAILLSLGFWQLERRAWKEDLLAQIASLAYGEPAPLPATWDPAKDEFRRVRVTGTFVHEAETPVHGLAPGVRGRPLQGFYLFTPLRLPSGSLVMVNRGIVPTELRDPATRPESRLEGEVAVTGLLRNPEQANWFMPENRPETDEWFARKPQQFAAAKGLSAPPFYIEAEAGQPGTWPRGGQFQLDIPNNHLQYALTWFGIALTLITVFVAFVRRRLSGEPEAIPTEP